MLGAICYILLSLLVSPLDTIPGTITFLVTLAVCLLGFSMLLCVIVRRGNRQERRMENTAIIPSVRAGKLRRRYL